MEKLGCKLGSCEQLWDGRVDMSAVSPRDRAASLGWGGSLDPSSAQCSWSSVNTS